MPGVCLARLDLAPLIGPLGLAPEGRRKPLAHIAQHTQHLIRYGALADDGDTIVVKDRHKLAELAGITRNFLESYRMVLLSTHAFRSRDISQRDLPEKIQEFGRGRLAVDDVQRSESLSLVNIRNALRAFREEGIVQHRSGGGLHFETTGLKQYTTDIETLLQSAESRIN